MALYKGFFPNWLRLGPWNIIVSFFLPRHGRVSRRVSTLVSVCLPTGEVVDVVEFCFITLACQATLSLFETWFMKC